MSECQMVDQYIDGLKNGSDSEKVAAFIFDHIWIEGDHHRLWVLDQALRMLVNQEQYSILQTIYEYQTGFSWDEGIAP